MTATQKGLAYLVTAFIAGVLSTKIVWTPTVVTVAVSVAATLTFVAAVAHVNGKNRD